eukprot:scaffold85588_cov21-Tisochrysis_lutea.AAC.2
MVVDKNKNYLILEGAYMEACEVVHAAMERSQASACGRLLSLIRLDLSFTQQFAAGQGPLVFGRGASFSACLLPPCLAGLVVGMLHCSLEDVNDHHRHQANEFMCKGPLGGEMLCMQQWRKKGKEK